MRKFFLDTILWEKEGIWNWDFLLQGKYRWFKEESSIWGGSFELKKKRKKETWNLTFPKIFTIFNCLIM